MRLITIEEVENGYVITTAWKVDDSRYERTKEVATDFAGAVRALVGWEYGIEVFYDDEKRGAVGRQIDEMLRSAE